MMKGIFKVFENSDVKLTRPFRVVLAILLSIFIFNISNPASAADLTNRSITIQSPVVSTNTVHSFRFSTNTNAAVGSILFEYCSNLPIYGSPCTAPTGLNVSGAGIFSQSGLTGFSVSGLTNSNRIVLTRAPSIAAPVTANFVFSNVVNQSFVGTVYVRISTHSSIDVTGPPVDNGSVVYSTSTSVGVGGFVPPFLTFCVGVTVAVDCTTTAGQLVSFGEFSEFSTTATTTQFSVATNDESGFNTFLNGQTLTSGNEIINGLSSNSASSVGTSQFGINLRANSNPSVGSEKNGSGSSNADNNYNSPNSFRFGNGERVAFSSIPSDFTRFTVSYIVNISENQKPGTYSSTLTYTAIASF